jgi:hypothetical protein
MMIQEIYSNFNISDKDLKEIKKIRNIEKEIKGIYIEYLYYCVASFTFSTPDKTDPDKTERKTIVSKNINQIIPDLLENLRLNKVENFIFL